MPDRLHPGCSPDEWHRAKPPAGHRFTRDFAGPAWAQSAAYRRRRHAGAGGGAAHWLPRPRASDPAAAPTRLAPDRSGHVELVLTLRSGAVGIRDAAGDSQAVWRTDRAWPFGVARERRGPPCAQASDRRAARQSRASTNERCVADRPRRTTIRDGARDARLYRVGGEGWRRPRPATRCGWVIDPVKIGGPRHRGATLTSAELEEAEAQPPQA
jgi:hypothetical protein